MLDDERDGDKSKESEFVDVERRVEEIDMESKNNNNTINHIFLKIKKKKPEVSVEDSLEFSRISVGGHLRWVSR
jgi:hypothetical protein